MRGLWSVSVLALCFAAGACGDDGGGEPAASSDSDTGPPALDADAGDAATGSRDAGTRPDAGGAAGSSAPDAGAMRDAGSVEPDAAPPVEPLMPLPEGSREVDEIVNLVDSDAAEELDEFLVGTPLMHAVLRTRLLHSVNLFLQHYEEVYDFVFLFTDHPLPNTGTVAAFESLNRPAAPGGVNEIEIALGGYRTTGRLRGMIGVQFRPRAGAPLAHEIMHYWAVDLDPRFGFGRGLTDDEWVSHWGFTSVHGQLGGFDGSTLRCETPAGASPPACTAGTNGRTRYVVGQFHPNDNTYAPYAPLELYLMGLLPIAEVPQTFQSLTRAEVLLDSHDAANRTIVVEADGVTQIAFADIVARHGEIELLPEDERRFSAAFVVISSEPAADDVMEHVAELAAAFGNRGTSAVMTPFETTAGGSATLDTTLGPRRKQSAPAPEPRERFACDVLAQDCPRPELGCYRFNPSFCALSRGVQEGEPCDTIFACAPGLDCYSGPSDPNRYLCTPYCNPDDASGSLACAALCPGMELVIVDPQDNRLGAVCLN